MEMTPAQLMEAEMTASGILDDVMMGVGAGGGGSNVVDHDDVLGGVGLDPDEPLFPGFPPSSSTTDNGVGQPSSNGVVKQSSSSFLNFYDDEDQSPEVYRKTT